MEEGDVITGGGEYVGNPAEERDWRVDKSKKMFLLDSPSTLALLNLGFKAILEPWQIAGGFYHDLLLL